MKRNSLIFEGIKFEDIEISDAFTYYLKFQYQASHYKVSEISIPQITKYQKFKIWYLFQLQSIQNLKYDTFQLQSIGNFNSLKLQSIRNLYHQSI